MFIEIKNFGYLWGWDNKQNRKLSEKEIAKLPRHEQVEYRREISRMARVGKGKKKAKK